MMEEGALYVIKCNFNITFFSIGKWMATQPKTISLISMNIRSVWQIVAIEMMLNN